MAPEKRKYLNVFQQASKAGSSKDKTAKEKTPKAPRRSSRPPPKQKKWRSQKQANAGNVETALDGLDTEQRVQKEPRDDLLTTPVDAPSPEQQPEPPAKKIKTSKAPVARKPVKEETRRDSHQLPPTSRRPSHPPARDTTTKPPAKNRPPPAPSQSAPPPAKETATKPQVKTKPPPPPSQPLQPPAKTDPEPKIKTEPGEELWGDEVFALGEASAEQLAKEDALRRGGEKFLSAFNVETAEHEGTHRVDRYSNLFGHGDFSSLTLRPDHRSRPMWIDPGRGIFMLERFSPMADQATDFLITIAEPRSRPTYIHEYRITAHSLYAAVATGLQPADILRTLDVFLKTELPPRIEEWIETCAQSYGKVKLVLRRNRYFLESTDLNVLHTLLQNDEIAQARLKETGSGSDGITSSKAPAALGVAISGTADAAGVKQANLPSSTTAVSDPSAALRDEDEEDESDVIHAFEIREGCVETVQRACLELNFPILEEYDFRCDELNANLEIDLRPNTQIRPYQEKSLSKMFGNGRAKSGVIVLPCGAGKTLVGITAACTIKKGAVVLCTNATSAVQWRAEFIKWCNIDPADITLFTADTKETFRGATGVVVTTYAMVTNARGRSGASQRMMDFLMSREWGLMLLDEVHVSAADVFRRVVSTVKAHAKLGLTATLLREDDRISDLNFLIGPKLFEANWMELSEQGHIARVQCAEVWCPMPPAFLRSYYSGRLEKRVRLTLCSVNPNKYRACEYLVRHHEARGDKVLVFSDDIYTLQMYALKMGRAFIYGGTSHEERLQALENFRHNPRVNTLFLSKIGDTSLDLPEATCLIQVSSQGGSRRQEAQRLGRILRAKRRNDEGFNAFFYSLVSKDTREMRYSAKRQAFLVDQGYAFKIITKLQGLDGSDEYSFATEAEKDMLLQATIADHGGEDSESDPSESESELDESGRKRKKAPRGGRNVFQKRKKRRAKNKQQAKETGMLIGEALQKVLSQTGGVGAEAMAAVKQAGEEHARTKTRNRKAQGESSAFFKKMGRLKKQREEVEKEEQEE